jgi:hypothetical protein
VDCKGATVVDVPASSLNCSVQAIHLYACGAKVKHNANTRHRAYVQVLNIAVQGLRYRKGLLVYLRSPGPSGSAGSASKT